MPIALPSTCGSGRCSHATSTTQVALLPSSVRSPNSGTKPAMEPNISMMPELRLQRAPNTELAKTTALLSAQLKTSPRPGRFPTSGM